MTEIAADFRTRLRAREPLLGVWMKTPSPIVAEVLGQAPLDCVCIDAEHAPFDRLAIDGCVAAFRAASKPSLVRVPAAREEHILGALDCGASGVVIPHVTSAEEAAKIAKASHYGVGGRGFAGSTRAAGYGALGLGAHLKASRAGTSVIAQIEDVEAVERIDAIAAVEDIDCLFIGRIDLTVALGADTPAHPSVVEAVERICAAGAAAGRAIGMFVGDLQEIPRWRAAGASLFLLKSDQAFLLEGAQGLRAAFDGAG